MSNISGDEGSFSSGNNGEEVYQESKQQQLQNHLNNESSSGPSGACNSNGSTNQQQNKKKRNLPGTPGKYYSASIIVASLNCSLTNCDLICLNYFQYDK